jgi:hypothetical protein
VLFHSVQSSSRGRSPQVLELQFHCYHSSLYFLTSNLYGLSHNCVEILLQFQFSK